MNHPNEAGPYIWLRYTTQYQNDGQTHTVDVSIPIPPGASLEQRSALIRDAKSDMNQLINYFTHHSAQKVLPDQEPEIELPVVAPIDHKPQMVQQEGTPAHGTKAVHNQQSSDSRVGTRATSTRPQGGEQLLQPTKNKPTSDLPIPVFIQHIREHFNLDAKQAMDLLKVKTLNINRREAIERLKQLTSQKNANAPAQPPGHGESEVVATSAATHQEPAANNNHKAQAATAFDEEINWEKDSPSEEDHAAEMPIGFDEEEL